ncbi:putative xylanase/chitin deacetylase [Lachnospiraceae bacterium JC7]|nr:putative xylanase/chitin deacetylase [Lachnospiraceae bacterium JC7]
MTNAEKQERLERHRRALRKKKARQRAYTYRMIAVFGVLAVVFIIWKAVTGITGYITDSRQQKVDAMQDIEINKGNDSIDVVGQTFAPETTAVVTTEATVETTEAYDPTHVLSNGRYVDTTKPMVALTWDDGPNGSTGEKIMDALEAYNGRGTFFLVGNRIDDYASEVKRMAANGHEVANHSWDHDTSLSKKSADYIRDEFEKTNAKILEVTGTSPALVRLPGGIITDAVRSSVTQPMIFWSIDTIDWKTKDAQKTIDSIESQVKDGDIVLMHELYTATQAASEVVIPWLAQQGYQMVTVSELIAFRNAEVVGGNGKQYSSFPYVAPPETTAAAVSGTASANVSETGTKAQPKETASETKKSEQSTTKASTEVETSATETAAASTEANADGDVIEAPAQEDDTYVPTSAQEAQKVSETAAWMAVGQAPGAVSNVQSDAIQAAAPN